MENLVSPAVITELQNTNVAIRRSTRKHASALVGGPGDHVHGRSMERKVENFGPGAARDRRRRVLVLFAPDKHLSIV